LKGYDPETVTQPEYYLQLTLPCPPPLYCADREWKDKCEGGWLWRREKVYFSYFLDLNAVTGVKTTTTKLYNVRCDMGFKVDKAKNADVYKGLTCEGGETKGRANVPV
ncbi:hypothetical protein PFISCL1PPCAC_1087, partial [Pristionchus fissidentatus]